MKAEVRFTTRVLFAAALLVAVWPGLSAGYGRALVVVTPAVASLFGSHVAAGPSGLSLWLLPAFAVLLGAARGWVARLSGVAITLAVSLAVDVCVLVAAASAGGSAAQSLALYAAVHAVLPFAAVLVFLQGRPSRLWEGA